MRSYTVVGAGAVGLLYGTRLAAAGHPVRWVVRSGADEIERRGIGVRTGGELLAIGPDEVEVHTDPSSVPPSDTVIVALKTTANDQLAELVAPAVAAGATVAMFQNGLGAEDQVGVAVPHAGAVLGALCFVCAQRTAPGMAEHLDYGAVTVGPAGPDGADAASQLVEDLTTAGIEASAVADLVAARWRKLVWNIPFNGLSVVLDASTDAMLAHPHTRALVSDLMDEVVDAAAACGHPLEPGVRDQMLAMTDQMTPYAPSMKLDHDAGRTLELDAIYQAPLVAAADAGAEMRRVEVLHRQLRFLGSRRP